MARVRMHDSRPGKRSGEPIRTRIYSFGFLEISARAVVFKECRKDSLDAQRSTLRVSTLRVSLRRRGTQEGERVVARFRRPTDRPFATAPFGSDQCLSGFLLFENLSEVGMLTTFYLTKNDHRWVIFVSLKTIRP